MLASKSVPQPTKRGLRPERQTIMSALPSIRGGGSCPLLQDLDRPGAERNRGRCLPDPPVQASGSASSRYGELPRSAN